MNKPPAFQFYVKEYLTSKAVISMTPAQRGYYMHLLCHAWDSDRPGYLPDDPALLWKLAGATSRESFERESALVLAEFPKAGRGVRANKRLVNERRSQIARSEQFSRSGSAGAAAKWGASRGTTTPSVAAKSQVGDSSEISNLHGDATVSPMAKNGFASASAFASASVKRKPTPPTPPARAGGNSHGNGAPPNKFPIQCRDGSVVEVFVPIGRKLLRDERERSRFENFAGDDGVRLPYADCVMEFFKLKGFRVEKIEPQRKSASVG